MVYESRIFKQAGFISKNYDFEKVILLGIWREGTSKNQLLENKIHIKRIFLLNIQNRSILYFYYFIYVFVFIFLKRPSLVNIHTLEFLPMVLIAKIFKIKTIYDPHELETEKNNIKGLRKLFNKWLEHLFIKKVDHIFVVSENIADWYKKTYNIQRPTVVFNSQPAQHIKKRKYFKNFYNLRGNQIIIITHGILAAERGIKLLLEAFKKRTNDKVVIVFMGNGDLKEEIQLASKSYKNIFFHKMVRYDKVLNYVASADIGIHLPINKCLSYDFSMPNKIFDYVMAGLPIIAFNTKDLSKFIKKNQIGSIIMSNTVEAINQEIDNFLSMDLNSLKKNVKKVALKYSWQQQEKKMKKIYQNLHKRM